MQSPIKKPIQLADFNAIKSIADACFGENYLNIHQLNKIIAGQGLYLKLEVDHDCIGFCLVQFYESHEQAFSITRENHNKTPFAVVKTLAIAPEYQRLGYGHQLLHETLQRIKSVDGISEIYYPSWVESQCEGFSKNLKHEGFRVIQEYPEYWYHDSVNGNYRCLKCGSPPCSCSMRLYKKMF